VNDSKIREFSDSESPLLKLYAKKKKQFSIEKLRLGEQVTNIINKCNETLNSAVHTIKYIINHNNLFIFELKLLQKSKQKEVYILLKNNIFCLTKREVEDILDEKDKLDTKLINDKEDLNSSFS